MNLQEKMFLEVELWLEIGGSGGYPESIHFLSGLVNINAGIIFWFELLIIVIVL